MAEHETQAAFFDYIRWKQWDTRIVIAAIPNGAKLPWFRNKKGARVAPQAKKLLREGLLPGFPDVGVFAARSGYHGLFIEFKYGRNKQTEEQRRIQALLELAGFRYVVSYTVDHAIAEFENYIGGKL